MRSSVLLFIALAIAEVAWAERFDKGTWRFDKAQFSARHTWLPGFLKKRALKTRLVIGDSTFEQYDDKGRLIDDASRPLEVLSMAAHKISLRYQKEGAWVSFAMERRAGAIYYVDKKGEYLLLRCEVESSATWGRR